MLKRNYKVFMVVAMLLTLVVSGQAQSKMSKTAASSKSEAVQAADERDAFRKEFVKATEEYKASLQGLATSYEGDVKRLVERNGKLKELYTEGLIARRELEASETALAEAQAKVDDTRKQIATTEAVLLAALKPASADEIAANTIATMPSEPRSWTTGNAKVDQLIRYNGARYGVDPYLIYCVMHQESRFGSQATSGKGAQGLMQLMPGTAARYGVTNSYDPAQNIMGGTRYLKDLLQLFNGRINLVLAGYNAGEGAVMKYGNRIPPYRETQNYVRTISTRYGQDTHVTPTLKTVPQAKPTARKKTAPAQASPTPSASSGR
jgi:soluble lytic murein transglycosylase-like protein